MKPNHPPLPRLIEVEQQVVAEAREWGRQRLQERLQQLADQSGGFSPLGQRKRRPLTLQSELGEIKLIVDYGRETVSGRWVPIHGLRPRLAVRLRSSGVTVGPFVRSDGISFMVSVPSAVRNRYAQDPTLVVKNHQFLRTMRGCAPRAAGERSREWTRAYAFFTKQAFRPTAMPSTLQEIS